MKTLYLECNMGAAGDMLMAALLELHPDSQAFIKRLNSIGIPNVKVAAEPSVKCGITGTHVTIMIGDKEEESWDVHHGDHHHSHGDNHHGHDHVHSHGHHHEHEHNHGHHHEEHHHEEHHHNHAAGHAHNSMDEISHLISHLNISDKVRADANAVYALIAEAESHAHGVPVNQIHFHEVGELDAVTDIVGVCMLIDELEVEDIIASAVHVGSGQVRCAHGIMPVPAPATAHILKDVPVYSGSVKGELCTPTGAAILKHFARDFTAMPVMRIQKVGYGMGKKDFEAANCVRAILGETGSGEGTDEVTELSCNIDDMTPEALAYAKNLLLSSGALDVYTLPIDMKKDRSGYMLSVLCRNEDRAKIVELIFKHTSTIGIRESVMKRYVLNRETVNLETPYGKVRGKKVYGYGTERIKPEFDDVSQLANEKDCSINDILKSIK